jgi:hypothetical protein
LTNKEAKGERIRGWIEADGVHILAIGRRMSNGFSLNYMKLIASWDDEVAKRHFGYQTDERLKPKCP